MRDVPPDDLDPAPPGTPPARRDKRPSVYCVAHRKPWHWVFAKAQYVAEDALAGEIPGHEVGAVEVAAIPCGETSAVDPERHPDVPPWSLT